jgi:hypothetical protein
MSSFELFLFDMKYAAAQVFYHIPRESGIFWWMVISAVLAAVFSCIWIVRRIAHRRDGVFGAVPVGLSLLRK